MQRDTATLPLFPDILFAPVQRASQRIERFNFLDPEEVQVREYGSFAAEIIRDGKNYGLILATSLGKTFIAFLVMDHCLTKGKIFFLAPHTALCEQHLEKARVKFTKNIDFEEINVISGDTPAKKRAELYAKSRIVIGTPQTLLHDLEDDFDRPVTLNDVSLVIFDEMHLAARRYAYVPLADRAKLHGIQILGLTASPGGTKEKIARIKRNLHLDHWLRFSLEDDEIKRFRFPRSETVLKIQLGDELAQMRVMFFEAMEEAHRNLAETGYLNDPFPITSETRLIEIGSSIRKSFSIASEDERYTVGKSYSLWATYYKLHKALVYLITESYEQFTALGANLIKQAGSGDNQAASRIVGDKRFLDAWNKAQTFLDQKTLHPKQQKLLDIIRERGPKEKILVFCRYIVANREIVDLLRRNGFSSVSYIGKKEMPTKKQREVIAAFEAGTYSVMVATAAGQLGLDMSVDTVIDYSVPQNGEEMIQRHGRCGRHREGHIFTILMDDELDLHHYYACRTHKRIMAAEAERDSRELKERALVAGLPHYPVTHASLFSGKLAKTEHWVADIKPNTIVHERFKVVSGRLKTSEKRGPYVYFKLADKTAVITLFHPVKDVVSGQAIANHLRSGRVCIVCAEAADWNGSTILRVNIRQDQFMVLCPESDYDPADYVELKQKPLDPNF